MSKHGPSEVVITIEDAPGGTVRTMTPYVTSISGVGVESITEQSNPFGVTSEQHTPIGVDKSADIVLGGFFDETATTGPHVVFNITAGDKAPSSVGRVFTFLPMTGKTFTMTVHLVKYEITAKRDGLTEYQATLRQKSAGVWS
jgi:hypothetical protein